jgi:WD repeat and SOF domain-containing protein 1
MNATKMDKIFAKPYLGCLNGHSDSISVLSKSRNNLIKILSGSYDGEIRAWDVS